MLLFEIDKSDIRNFGIEKAIKYGLYTIRDDNFIKCAFNFGNGTKKHMNQYMKNNRNFCVWIDAETMKQISKI